MFGGFTIFHRTCLGAFLRFTGCKSIRFLVSGYTQGGGRYDLYEASKWSMGALKERQNTLISSF